MKCASSLAFQLVGQLRLPFPAADRAFDEIDLASQVPPGPGPARCMLAVARPPFAVHLELRLGAAELRELNRIGVNLNQVARAGRDNRDSPWQA